MKPLLVLFAGALLAACHAAPATSNDSGPAMSSADGTEAPVTPGVLENAAVKVTLLPDASLSVLVKATSFTWTAPAPAMPYAVSALVTTPTAITATLARGTESWNVTLTLAHATLTNATPGFEVAIATSNGAAHTELPGFPYPFALPTDTGYYVQNTSSDGLLFKLSEASSIQNMYDFIAIPWWGLTDLHQAMMAILETPYMPAGKSNERSVVLAPAKLEYLFVPQGTYVELARAYRAYMFDHNPGMEAATLAASTKPGIANFKDGAYVYFWDDAQGKAQDATFMKSVHDYGLAHTIAMIYHGNTTLDDAQIGALYQNVETTLGWTPGMYTLPGANLGVVAAGEWPRQLTLGTKQPEEFWNDPNTHTNGFAKTCMKQAMLGPAPITDTYKTTNAAWHNEANYFDTFVVQVAPCLDPAHVQHAPRLDGMPLPSSIDEDRDYRVKFLQAIHDPVADGGLASITGSGEGLAPAWAIPHVDYFEGAMILGEYGELHTMIPAGDYEQDFATSIDPANAGRNTDELHRIPLFELMFHDHVATTWNWRNTNYQNIVTAPKKDLLNALYGTVPMYNISVALWAAHKDALLASYNFTKGTRSLIGFSDMTGFGYLSDDHELQYTDWDGAGGPRVIANFSAHAQMVGTKTVPALGYVVTTHP